MEGEIEKLKKELQNYKDFVEWFGVEDEYEFFIEIIKEEEE